MSKAVLAIAAALAIGSAAMTTGAIARPMSQGSSGSHPSFSGSTGSHPSFGGPTGSNPSLSTNARPAFTPNNQPNANGNNRLAYRDHNRFRGGLGSYGYGGPSYDYYDYDPGYDNGCWQRELVRTPYGLRWRLVNVC
jgi:hypothetical protein